MIRLQGLPYHACMHGWPRLEKRSTGGNIKDIRIFTVIISQLTLRGMKFQASDGALTHLVSGLGGRRGRRQLLRFS